MDPLPALSGVPAGSVMPEEATIYSSCSGNFNWGGPHGGHHSESRPARYGAAAPGQALLAVGGGTLAFVRCIQ